MKEPSVAPGFGMTFLGLARSLVAFSNIASRIAIGTVVIPLFTALMAADGADAGVTVALTRSSMASFLSPIPALRNKDSFLLR